MKTETIYSERDLVPGKCKCCGEKTDIVKTDGRCPDCIEEEKFFNETMKDL